MLMAGKSPVCQETRRFLVSAAGRQTLYSAMVSGFAFGRSRIRPGRSVDLIARLYQPVTDTQFGNQNFRRVGVWFDLLAQLAHEDAQVMRVVHVDGAPHFL